MNGLKTENSHWEHQNNNDKGSNRMVKKNIESDIICREVSGKQCYLYERNMKDCIEKSAAIPVILWGMEFEKGNEIEELKTHLNEYLNNKLPEEAYLLVAYEVEDWNHDFSIWEYSELGFGGGGENTLEWIVQKCIPFIKDYDHERYPFHKAYDFYIAGYSLAGLFSLWSFYKTNAFKGVVCCSGSLWFPKWDEFMKSVKAPENGYAYLSLGKKEEHTKNKWMATVGERTRMQEKYLSLDEGIKKYILEWNEGGHFTEPEKRMAKGMAWMLEAVSTGAEPTGRITK